ncbi:hypothetical protein JVT61DRAFT_1856 [Boletus reticuloceps]|uniref:DUF6532 domain-containing protein n=1 Tax=Boletus reticuloceps TaxID=495285 RepID=A0A8I2YRL9_9AGAM|nr:hypothetical protein JVT61DRAFT_1856 [Boletus reticuloceps]
MPRIPPTPGAYLASTPLNDKEDGGASTSHKQARDTDQLERSDDSDRCYKKSKRGRERSAQDLSMDTQAVLKVAYSHFKCKLATVNPFPDVSGGIEDFILESISVAREQTALTVTMGFQEINLVSMRYDLRKCMLTMALGQVKARVPQLRGQVKSLACDKVKAAYGFIDPQENGDGASRVDANMIEANRLLVEALKYKSTFAYLDPRDRSVPNSMYRNPLILKVIKTVWFSDVHADGVRFGTQYFSPLPVKVIAFVLTAIECAIDEWSTGTPKKHNFEGKKYSAVYVRHLKDLELWSTFSEKYARTNPGRKDLAAELLRELLQKAR